MKPQWKASIDFKWIRDNKVAMAANIENRNSSANLELVLELYEKMLTVQKVRVPSCFCHFEDIIRSVVCFVDFC